MSILRVFALFLLVGCQTLTGGQTPDNPNFTRDDLKQMVQSDNFINSMIAHQGIPARHVPAYREHYRDLYAEDLFIDRIYRKIARSSRSAGSQEIDPRTVMNETVRQILDPDLLRLSPKKLEDEYMMATKILNFLPIPECATFMRMDPSVLDDAAKMKELESRLLAPLLKRLDKRTLKRHLANERVALKAEWRNSPAARKLSRSEISQVENLMLTKLISDAVSLEKYGKHLEIYDNPAGASDQQVCEAGRAIGRLMQELAESMGTDEERDLLYRYIESDL